MAMKFESLLSELEKANNLAPEDRVKHIVNSICATLPLAYVNSIKSHEEEKMSKRVITFGTWENKPIEWIVLKEEKFKTLLISKERICRKYFGDNSNQYKWCDSSLRDYLNDTFWNTAFTKEEKKKIVNTILKEDATTKDNVFILSYYEVESMLTENDDVYRQKHGHDCSYCCWTRSNNGRGTYNMYADCNCNHYPNTLYSVRPAIYIKSPIK